MEQRRDGASRSFRQQTDERRAALCDVRVREVQADDVAEVTAAASLDEKGSPDAY
jgi:hypothetical protein